MRPVGVIHDNPDDFRDLLAGRFPGVDFRYASTGEEVPPMLEGAGPEVVFSIKYPGLPGEVHRPCVEHPTVRWVHVGGSGFDHLIPWDAGRITVTNSVGVLSPFLAETVTGAILALNGGFLDYVERRRRREWRARAFRPLAGQTLLVVGLGHIGGHVAANAKALGMHVLAIRRSREPHPAVDELLAPGDLLVALPRADFVSLHVRVDDGTRHLMNAATLAAMKPGACLVNTSRGAVVDEAALVEALRGGHLAGAYLDVYETEPLPASSPLWDMENVLLTPHASDNVVGWPRRFAELFADNLERWIAGEPLVNVVRP